MEESKKVTSVTSPDFTAYPPAQSSLRQRASIRKTVACTVQLRHGATLILPRTVEDLNLTGIFVEMDTQGVSVSGPEKASSGLAGVTRMCSSKTRPGLDFYSNLRLVPGSPPS